MGEIIKNNNLWTVLKTRPWVALQRNEHLLHRLEGFISGMSWALDLQKIDNIAIIDLLLDFHNGVASELQCSPVVWFNELLERNGNDEELAFRQAVDILGKIGEAKGLWCTDYVEPDPYCGSP